MYRVKDSPCRKGKCTKNTMLAPDFRELAILWRGRSQTHGCFHPNLVAGPVDEAGKCVQLEVKKFKDNCLSGAGYKPVFPQGPILEQSENKLDQCFSK